MFLSETQNSYNFGFWYAASLSKLIPGHTHLLFFIQGTIGWSVFCGGCNISKRTQIGFGNDPLVIKTRPCGQACKHMHMLVGKLTNISHC